MSYKSRVDEVTVVPVRIHVQIPEKRREDHLFCSSLTVHLDCSHDYFAPIRYPRNVLLSKLVRHFISEGFVIFPGAGYPMC